MISRKPPPEGMVLYPSGFVGFATNSGNIEAVDVPPPGTFLTTRGPDEFDLVGSGYLGVQGLVDLHLTWGEPPGRHQSRVLFTLLDDVTGAGITAVVEGTTNGLSFQHVDPTGTVVAAAGLLGPFPTGGLSNIIYLWDAEYPVTDTGEYAFLWVDGETALWTTTPGGTFYPFVPTRVIFGQEPTNVTPDFDGKITLAHLSDNGHPAPAAEGSLSAFPAPPGPWPWPWPRPWPRPHPGPIGPPTPVR